MGRNVSRRKFDPRCTHAILFNLGNVTRVNNAAQSNPVVVLGGICRSRALQENTTQAKGMVKLSFDERPEKIVVAKK